MTPHEQHILGVVTAAADDIVAGLDRLDANTRTEVAARVIARLTHTQHLDA